jgi:hypothetical protein
MRQWQRAEFVTTLFSAALLFGLAVTLSISSIVQLPWLQFMSNPMIVFILGAIDTTFSCAELLVRFNPNLTSRPIVSAGKNYFKSTVTRQCPKSLHSDMLYFLFSWVGGNFLNFTTVNQWLRRSLGQMLRYSLLCLYCTASFAINATIKIPCLKALRSFCSNNTLHNPAQAVFLFLPPRCKYLKIPSFSGLEYRYFVQTLSFCFSLHWPSLLCLRQSF